MNSEVKYRMDLLFQHLYGEVVAVTFPARKKWERPVIIMPQGFKPELDKRYECFVNQTLAGTFVYDGITYDLAYAILVESASIIDVIENSLSREKLASPLAAALKKINKSELPKSHDVWERRAVRDRKNGGCMLEPAYETDGEGNPTMIFFNLESNISLEPGKLYRFRKNNALVSGHTNKQGAQIIKYSGIII